MKLVQVEKSPEIMAFLEKNHYMNLNILGKIENRPDLPIFTDNPEAPSGVLVKSGYMHFLYTESEAFTDAVLREHMDNGFFGFAGVDKRICTYIQGKARLHWQNPCSIYAYKKAAVEQIETEYDVKPLEPVHAKLVDDFYEYRGDHSLEEIKKDIEYRPSSAVYVDGEPVCWVLVHEDNSMGIMYTREAFRRLGLAEIVTRDLTKRILERGNTPYLQIVDGNVKSHGLAAKSGFEPVGLCEWFGIIVGWPTSVSTMIESAHGTFMDTFETADFQPGSILDSDIESGRLDQGERSAKNESGTDMFYMIDWRPESFDPAYTFSDAREENSVEEWQEHLGLQIRSSAGYGSFEPWMIHYKGTYAGSLVIQFVENEDAAVHKIHIQEGIDPQAVLTALMHAVFSRGYYFIGARVDETYKEDFLKMGFVSKETA